MVQTVNNPPAMQETQVRYLGGEDPLQKEMATHPSILAWEIPWTKEPRGLQSTGSQEIRHNLETKPPLQDCIMSAHIHGGDFYSIY